MIITMLTVGKAEHLILKDDNEIVKLDLNTRYSLKNRTVFPIGKFYKKNVIDKMKS
ncbi:hypothetical protein [Chryseobacterium flavum]|uniref:hypothetical protein n=1 Tax=Chryseobacterium flavum TaxID=415851 RepID=UPI0028AB56F7|nr:hypothetical protein [Chryseobacterium flavum]